MKQIVVIHLLLSKLSEKLMMNNFKIVCNLCRSALQSSLSRKKAQYAEFSLEYQNALSTVHSSFVGLHIYVYV